VARFEIFGLRFESDRLLSGCGVAPVGGGTDVRLFLSNHATSQFDALDWKTTYPSTHFDRRVTPILIIQKDSAANWIRMRYFDDTAFVLDRAGTQIHASWASPCTAEDAATYLLGPVLGMLLYLRGHTCLHASAVEHRGKALVFVGGAEAGKSTLAAAFARRGKRVLTDDILSLVRRAGKIEAHPGIPRIGLWGESVAHLWGSEGALPRQTPSWEKRQFDLVEANLYQDAPLPVSAVYVLSEREPRNAVCFTPLAGYETLLQLIANKYVTRVSERSQDQRDFILLSEVASSLPIKRIARSNALSDLDSTCDAILHDASVRSSATV
jgi:hypothetical protein